MPNRTNQLMVKELVSYLGDVEDMIFLDYRGMSALEVDGFRGGLASGGGRMRVVKNSVTRIALEELGRGEVAGLITGSVAILHGDDIIAIAKAAAEITRKNRAVEVVGGVLGGTVLEAAEAAALAKMPSRVELLGQIASQILAPATNISSAAGSGGANIAACVKQRIEDLERDAA